MANAEQRHPESAPLTDEMIYASARIARLREELAAEREENLRLRRVIDAIGNWDNAAAGCSRSSTAVFDS